MDDHASLFGHGAEVLAGTRITREFVGAHNGMRTVVWEQQLDGIPIFQSALIAHITQKGELVTLSSTVIPKPDVATKMDAAGRADLANSPPMSARQAVVEAAKSIEKKISIEDVSSVPDAAVAVSSSARKLLVPDLRKDLRAQLVWLPMSRDDLRLCWKVELGEKHHIDTYLVLIDARTGEMLLRYSLTSYADSIAYHVFTSDSPSPFSPGHALPTNTQPSVIQRDTRTWTALNTNASPLGWTTENWFTTFGNNVDSRTDWYGEFLGYTENSSQNSEMRPYFPNGILDPPLDLEQDPLGSDHAGVAQLFFWCNWMHDTLYDLGFTEAAGNFQYENVINGVDRGGIGGDPLLADAQKNVFVDPFWNPTVPRYNFAAYLHASDGTSPRMVVSIWDGPEPDRDADLDAEIILHEYTHGLSTRTVGGGTGMYLTQPRGLGEGWSDFMALALLSESQDGLAGNYAMGGYTTRHLAGLEENYYYGIRRYPYSTNLAKNPLTLKDTDPTQASPHAGIPRNPIIGNTANEVHNLGEVWCAALWEMRANLIAAMGFTPGTEKALQLVVDGMVLSPPNPTFVEARDAILQANQVNYSGVHSEEIWAAFAKRGLGYSAAMPAAWSTIGAVEASDLPTPGGEIWSYETGNAIYSSPAIGVDGTIYVGSTDGKVYALNRDGIKKWDYLAGTNGSGVPQPFYSSPTVGSDGAIYVGGYDNKLHAINPDGTRKWTFTATNAVFSSPAIDNDNAIYFGGADGRVYALNPDGTLRWTYQAGGAISSSPAVDVDGVVYLGAHDSKFYAINPDGTLKWSKTVGAEIFNSPAILRSVIQDIQVGGSIYFAAADQNLYCVRGDNGATRWQFNPGTGGNFYYSSPVLDKEGNVYIGSDDGNIYSLDYEGTLRWSYQAGDIIYSSPALGDDGRVYFASYDRTLYALSSGGTLKSSFLLGGEVFSSPVIGEDGRLYVGSMDSRLYCYPAETLLSPSHWPMFRNDSRHFGNYGAVWFDGGYLRPDGALVTKVHASIYPLPLYVDELSLANNLVLEWSNTLTNWNRPARVFVLGSGINIITDAGAIGHDRYFYRARVSSYPNLRSRNPYGFIKHTVPPGDSIIANPLSTRSNQISALMPAVPDYTELWKWDEQQQGWIYHEFVPGVGWSPDTTLLPGEGAYVRNPTSLPFTVTFIGEVLQGNLERPLPSGSALVSAMVPHSGGVTSLMGYGTEDGLATGDTLKRIANPWVSHVTYLFNSSSGWSRTNPPSSVALEPQPGYGEAFWINSSGSRNWKKTFSVWP